MRDAALALEQIAAHLRETGNVTLRKELDAALRHAVEPVGPEIRIGLAPKLPNRYAAALDADLAIGTSVRSAGRVLLRGSTRGTGGVQGRSLRRLDRGILGHPVFGMRSKTNPRRWAVWEDQEVTPGWFTGPAQDAAPRVREELIRALGDAAAKAASKGA